MINKIKLKIKKKISKTYKLTNKQQDLLFYLYKFRFLNTNQLQKLFKHKNPRTVQEWLKNLKDNGYINLHKSNDYTKPIVYSLTKLSRKELKKNPKCEIEELNRVYQEDDLSESFINQCIFIADIYLNMLSQIKGQEKLHFSTKANLRGFDYLPTPMIDAFISIKSPKKTKRYFLILIDPRKPWRVQDNQIMQYTDYADNNNWSEVSSDPLPKFLIICPNEKRKQHFNDLIGKSLTSGLFYLATKNAIEQSGFNGDAWQKTE